MNWPVEPDGRGRRDRRTHVPMASGGRAVVGFDGTAASLDALAYAIGWACRLHGHVDVLHVPENRWQGVIDACAAASPVASSLECGIDLCALVGGAVTDLLVGTDLAWSYHTASGEVAHALEEHAASVGADAIIVGRPRRRHRYPRRASTGHRLLSCTDRIVIVVP